MSLPLQSSSQAIGATALRNFTIPRKKREDRKALLDPCPRDSRDFSMIQLMLHETKWDLCKETSLTWHWDNVKLINNEELRREFSEKRSEMCSNERHVGEMEERFCFLVTSEQKASQIYRHGLKVESTDEHSLGNPSYGVYLHKHIDVALRNSSGTPAEKILLIFKVLFGRVKKVAACFGRNGTHDPTVNYDCHMSRDIAVPRDSLSQQDLSSSVFVFDYNKNHELTLRPRQCLPYAMVSLVPVVNTSLNSTSGPCLKLGPKDSVSCLDMCTVAQRAGRGQNASATYQCFGTAETRCKPRVLGRTYPFKRHHQQNTRNVLSRPDELFHQAGNPPLPHFTSRDQTLMTPPPIGQSDQALPTQPPLNSWKPHPPMTSSNSSLPFASTRFLESHQLVADSLRLQTPWHAGVANTDHGKLCNGDQVQWQVASRQQYVTGALEQVSSVVYTSRAIRDPRLSGKQCLTSKGTEGGQQTDNLVCKLSEKPENNNICLTKQEKTLRETEFKNNPVPRQPEALRECSIAPLMNSSAPLPENQPDILKIKPLEYSPYLHLTEEERGGKIWPLQPLELHEKNTLLDRTFQESERHLSENDKITPADQSKPGSRNICLPITCTKDISSSREKTNTDLQIQNAMKSDCNSIHSPFEDTACSHEKNTDQIGPEDMNICSPGPTTIYITGPEYDRRNIPVDHQDKTALSNDPDDLPEMVTSESRQGTEAGSKLNSAVERKCQDSLDANLDASRWISEAGSQNNSVEERKTQNTVHKISDENTQSRGHGCQPTEGKKQSVLSSIYDTHQNTTEPQCLLLPENHIDIMEACEEVHYTDNPELVTAADSCPSVSSSQDCGRLSQKDAERNETDPSRGKTSKTSSTCDDTDNAEEDDSQAKDTINSFLFKRLQHGELFYPLNQNRTCLNSTKHYLKPKCSDHKMDVSTSTVQPDGTSRRDRRQKTNIRVTIIAHREYAAVTESPSLSMRFSASESLEGTQGSPIAPNDEKRTNNGVVGEDSDCILKANTYTTMNKAHAGNAALIKVMAEKYKGKENESVSKTNDPEHATVKKEAIAQKHVTDISYSEQNSSHQANIDHEQTGNGHFKVPPRNRNLKLKAFSPVTAKRNVRAETVRNKYKSRSKSKSAKVISHNISNCSKTPKQVPIKSRSSTIMKTHVFRRRNHWGTFSYKRMQGQGNMPTALSRPFCPSLDTNKHVRCKTYQMKPLKTLSRKLEKDQFTKDSKEKTDKENCVADVNTLQHSKEAQDLSNIETSQGPQSYSTISQSKLPSSNCQNMPGINKDNNDTNPEEYLHEENSLQADLHTMKEFKQSSGAMDSAKEIVSTSENMEVSLDSAIEILCGSALNSNIPEPQQETDLVLPLMSGQSKTQKAEASDKEQNCAPQEQDDQIKSSSREVKLISRLRDYLTSFESVVKNSTSDTLCGSTTSFPPICETLQNNANDQKEQPVQLVVLDRVELNHLIHNGPPIPVKACTPNHMIYNIEKEQMGQTTCNSPNDYGVTCISPDSTSMLKVPEKATISYLDKSTTEAEVSTSAPDITHWTRNAESCASGEQQRSPKGSLGANDMIMVKALKQLEPDNSEFCKAKGKSQDQKPTSHSVKLNTKSFYRNFTVGDISDALKLGDKSTSLVELGSVQAQCKAMLQYFILNFERKQNVEAYRTIVSRDQILNQYMDRPPVTMELKYEALNSFLELQIMMEAWQFVDNKMRYLSGQPTFRSMLWYDPTLYGELFKGKVGFQQQSSLYSSFQQSLINEGPIAMQRYHMSVSTLNQQLQRAPHISYYMYLKSKREKLEIEAALRNPTDIESFFLSVPLSCMVNLGNTVESLEKVQELVTTFTETPADKLEAGFDIGKAEHLAIVFRFLQEKICHLKSCVNTTVSKVSWFGMEHILYDASKILPWREVKQMMPHDQLAKYKKANPKIVYGVTGSGVSLLNTNVSKRNQPMVTTTTPARHRLAKRVHRTRGSGRGRLSTDKTCRAENTYPENASVPVIDLTTSPNRDDPNGHHWINTRSNPGTHIQARTQQQPLVRNHVAAWCERSSQPFFQPAPPYPDIRASQRSSNGNMDANSQINLLASLGGVASNSDGQQWFSNWNPQDFQNSARGDLGPAHPLWINVRDSGHAPNREPIPSEQTYLSPWTSYTSSSQQPAASVSWANTAQQSVCSISPLVSTTTHVTPLCETTPTNHTTHVTPLCETMPLNHTTHVTPLCETTPINHTTHVTPLCETTPINHTTHVTPLCETTPINHTTHGTPLCETTPMNYPFFLLNGQTYSTANPELSVAALDNIEAIPLNLM